MKYILLMIIFINLNANVLNNKQYDLLFKKEYRKHFYMYKDIYSWKIIKAQAIQESRLKKNAMSPVGARGLMQIMPATERDIKKQLGITLKNAALDPAQAIRMGVFYDKRMFVTWKSKRSLTDRYKLMLASYNAGSGNLIKSQKRCLYYKRRFKEANLRCNEYTHIEWFLHEVTGHNSKETITYIKRIFKYYQRLTFL